jgi:RNA polymerase sigma factor (sigma-70 family)
MDELASLVTRAQAGDTRAYGTLVNRFQDMAYGYAYAILGDFELAQDAAQEAFIEAYRCLPGLRQPEGFPGWFKRIVFKHCDRLTRRKRPVKTSIDAAFELAADVPGPAEIVERQEAQDTVLQAVRSLPAHEREVIALYYIDGYSQNEVAGFLNVPTTTVKSRLHASRKRLKERMLAMVQDALKSNALPENFTEETLAQAVAQAATLNKQRKFGQAEDLLRAVLDKSPNHTGALREINRTLMHGHVYGQGRWDRLPELVEHGRRILDSGSDDEYVYHEMARTLMAIPAMPQAIAFIEEWIEKQGRGLDRLGMLAWVRGCVAEYDAAESLWNDLLALVPDAPPEEVATIVQYVCLTLVDCFASVGETDRAVRVAQVGWRACRDLNAFPHEYGRPAKERTDARWLRIYHQAGLPLDDVGHRLLDKLGPEFDRDLLSQGVALIIRAWIEHIEASIIDWLDWAKACVQAEAWSTLRHISSHTGMSLRLARRPDALTTWARTTRQWLKTVPGQEAQSFYRVMRWEQFNGWTYLEADDLDGAEQVARQAMEEEGYPDFGSFLVDVAIRRGEPTPPDVVRFVEENGVKAIDEYGMTGWYVIAREAAAAGDVPKAFDALERAINYWSNPPYAFDRVWEKDAYWGDLREHPEYQRIYAEKRARIGPVYGQLHYFPGW